MLSLKARFHRRCRTLLLELELELELDDFLLDAAYGQAMSQRHADK